MALRIRLARAGAKKRPFYRIIVADARAPRDGRFIEKLGIYNPLLTAGMEGRLNLDVARAKHWLERGASASQRVAGFLAKEGLLKPQARNNPNKGKPGKKALERIEARKQKQAQGEEAAKSAEAAAKTQDAAPAANENEGASEEGVKQHEDTPSVAPTAGDELPNEGAGDEKSGDEKSSQQEASAEKTSAEEGDEKAGDGQET